jgi:hypothetical protein
LGFSSVQRFLDTCFFGHLPSVCWIDFCFALPGGLFTFAQAAGLLPAAADADGWQHLA